MIYHWCPKTDWEAAGDEYRPATFDADGFVHCSFRHQVERTATDLDRGREGLVLLCIDDLGLPVTVEDCYEAGDEFPHVYGPIPIDSVVAVLPFPPQPDGSFLLPNGVPE